jgi:hypothetical protein
LQDKSGDGSSGKSDDVCNHGSSKHKSLTPGIITCYCEHGRCLGAAMMVNPENPKTAFRFLLALFKTSTRSLTLVDET